MVRGTIGARVRVSANSNPGKIFGQLWLGLKLVLGLELTNPNPNKYLPWGSNRG